MPLVSSMNFHTCSSLRTYIVWLKALKNDIFQCISRSKNFQVISKKWGSAFVHFDCLKIPDGSLSGYFYMLYTYLLLLFLFHLHIIINTCIFPIFVHKSNKFVFKRELKEMLCWKLLTFSSRSPMRLKKSWSKATNLVAKISEKNRKGP